MTKEERWQEFWSGFGVEAYDENTVPDGAELPYITYEYADDSFGYDVISSVDIWDRSTSWKTASQIKDRIADAIGMGGKTLRYEGGMMWIKKGTPFARRTPDDNNSIRHIALNIETEFISEV